MFLGFTESMKKASSEDLRKTTRLQKEGFTSENRIGKAIGFGNHCSSAALATLLEPVHVESSLVIPQYFSRLREQRVKPVMLIGAA